MSKPAERLVSHMQVARSLGVSPRRVRDWVKAGHFPAPHATVARTMFYQAEDVERFIKTGSWFKERGGE